MNTQRKSYDNAKLEFEERCEFCALLLDLVDIRVLCASMDHHWTVCKNCYDLIVKQVKPQ